MYQNVLYKKFNVNIKYLRLRIQSNNGIRGEKIIEINEY
jgi:hypothetical protein